MGNITKTIPGIIAELTAATGLTPSYDTTLTLNAKYGIASATLPSSSNRPAIKYVGIGIGGTYNVDGENLTAPYLPAITDLDIYTPIPWRCVPLANDLSDAERSVYRMRVPMVIDEVTYVAYYLKAMTAIDNTVQVTLTDPVTLAETPYVLDPTNLNPTPTTSTTDGTIGTTTSEINVTTNHTITITGAEVLEAIDVLYGGDVRRARISEMGIYWGSDVIQTANDSSGTQFTYTEACMCQLGFHATDNGIDFSNSATSITRQIRIGKGDVALL